MKRRAVINLSTSKYTKGQDRLYKSLAGNTDADALMYAGEPYVGAPFHSEEPYAFKPYALDKARKRGYKQVLWLDASMYVLKDIQPIFDQITKDGYFFQDSGWMNDRWTTPEQANYFGTSEGRMISSGVIGLDFRTRDADIFFDRWLHAAECGMFRGSHAVTRHDQTCASLIIKEMELKITPNNTHWTYGKPDGQYPDNILILADGIC